MTKVSLNNLWGWKMDNSNIKLLSVYYSTEKLLKDDLASPLMSAIRPVINVQEHSYSLIVEKALPNLIDKVSAKKLLLYLNDRFSKIDSGEIKPFKFVGFELNADEIVEQVKIHDTFSLVYKYFFKELLILRYEHVDTVRGYVNAELAALNEHLNTREMKMLRKVISHQKSRSPLSLDLDILLEIIDTIHEVSATVCGPTIADLALSRAVMKTGRSTSAFDATIFL